MAFTGVFALGQPKNWDKEGLMRVSLWGIGEFYGLLIRGLDTNQDGE